VDTIRSQAIARSKEKSVGDLAATMREAVLWTERGRNVTEEDLNAMLEGREDISEVQDNPFADMIAEADAAESAQQAASAPAGDATQTATPEDAAIPTIQANAYDNAETSEAPNGASVLADLNKPSHIIEPTRNISGIEETAHTFEPVDEPSESAIEQESAEVVGVESEAADFESADDSIGEPTIVAGNINGIQGLNEQDVQQMSDEEFAAFMQKAQAFYDNASSAPSAANSVQPTTNFAQPVTSSTTTLRSQTSSTKSETSSTQFETNSTQTVSKNDWDEPASATVQSVQKEPEEDKYSSYSFGNEMTDEEYIAYLNRSARASRKEDEQNAAAAATTAEKSVESKPVKKSERKSFMPEEGEGGMTDEEFEAYLAEHGDDDDDEEGPVVYGAGKD
jgi:hypothetical protein